MERSTMCIYKCSRRKIVLLKRGKCNFADKLILAQDSGAIGVIVGDTETRDL